MSVTMDMRGTVIWEFTKEQFDEFMRPIEGHGGGQSFVRRCQGMMDQKARTLTLRGDDLETWFRYRNDYGSGGFQSRLGRQAVQQSLV